MRRRCRAIHFRRWRCQHPASRIPVKHVRGATACADAITTEKRNLWPPRTRWRKGRAQQCERGQARVIPMSSKWASIRHVDCDAALPLRPTSGSDELSDATADSHESVANQALVMPMFPADPPRGACSPGRGVADHLQGQAMLAARIPACSHRRALAAWSSSATTSCAQTTSRSRRDAGGVTNEELATGCVRPGSHPALARLRISPSQ